ncbi:adhesion G-protein coupled receptor F1-like [Scyliorhinus canicula]|uniref:adhesion G-protein coupled receptor F1-like n=1 Tax=Scyliorhinus canicula TaxID=7830 RepID=UPI0018F61EF4|nr:adhesion G-protein coupled receptor F1-like [Scyliorhinus canicula]
MDVMLLVIMIFSLLVPLSSSQAISYVTECSSKTYEAKMNGKIEFQGKQCSIKIKEFPCPGILQSLNITVWPDNANEFQRKQCNIKIKEFPCPGISQSSNITVCQDSANDNCSRQTDQYFGAVESGNTASINCSNNQKGTLKKRCNTDGTYGPIEDFCVLPELSNLLEVIQNATELAKNIDHLVGNLANISKLKDISTPGNLIATVDIIKIFASVTDATLNMTVMEDFFVTINTIVAECTLSAWKTAKTEKPNSSSQLLRSVESFTRLLSPTEDTFNISKPNIQLKGNKVQSKSNHSYLVNFSDLKVHNRSLSGAVTIDRGELSKLPDNSLVISIAYATLIDILDQSSNTNDSRVNGLIITTTAENNSTHIQMDFLPLDTTLDPASSQCVFWKFNLDGTGQWDSMGCKFELNGSNVVCKCTHLTSFSILMSRFHKESRGLDLITKITIGISMGCLVISLIIEGTVWSYVTKDRTTEARHIIMLNVILSLLTANICFTASGYLAPDTRVCMVMVFFIHFLYLALFFWMLTLALLLLYHLIFLFQGFSRAAMMIISLTLGYLCPLIIAVSIFTIAYFRNHYLRQDKCWMNTEQLYISLSLQVPQFTIVTINFFITIVAIFKMLRPTIGEKLNSHKKVKITVKQIARCIAILTSILGLSWALGFGFLNKETPIAINYAFDILNGLQGLFILVFGIIMDSKVQEALRHKSFGSSVIYQNTNLLNNSTSKSQ